MKEKSVIVTGGAGFIGSTLVRLLIAETNYRVIVLDKLTYAGNLESLELVKDSERLIFVKGDICDKQLVTSLFTDFKPCGIFHLAAESHVDRSIDGPADFIQTNIIGTFNLLQCSLDYFRSLSSVDRFIFQHISTDEVFGSLGETGLFTESTKYEPNSPYSASKASSDHLVRAWHKTYGLPVLVTNCSNNYGPYHYPEKLVPLMIINALKGKKLPVYGDGKQIRDWLFVEDHARALLKVFEEGEIGETYNVGGNSERTNLEVVSLICETLDQLVPESKYRPHSKLIEFVTDRPGHDRRYAIDCSKLQNSLGWKQNETFESGMKKTILWYLNNQDWVQSVMKNKYSGERLGVFK